MQKRQPDMDDDGVFQSDDKGGQDQCRDAIADDPRNRSYLALGREVGHAAISIKIDNDLEQFRRGEQGFCLA